MADLLDDPDAFTGSSDSDDFEVEKEIGRGGDGSFYLAFDKKVGRQVALKLIQSFQGRAGAGEQRFRAEMEAIASMDHPNIIPVYSNGELDGRLFYSMKFVSGGSLATRMEEFSTQAEVVVLMDKLARAIHHAHERGVLHRDIKPSNVLLDEEREPFISDFGLAKRSAQDSNLTLTGSIMGTPAYMSPEQARGDNSQVTTTSDIFSLGSIFFQLLTGRQAFEGDSPHVVLRKVIESEIEFPNQSRLKVDRDLKTVCLKCLQKNPEKRYQSALAFAEDLGRWMRGEPVEARPITSLERGVRWVKRYALLVLALSIAVISLVTSTLVSVAHRKEAEEARELAEQARMRSEEARLVSEENEYYLTVTNALAARERFEFGEARRLLDSVEPSRRGFEWRLVDGFSRGDQDWSSSTGGSRPLHLIRDQGGDRILLLTEDRRFHEVDPISGELTLAGELPETPGGSPLLSLRFGLLHFAFAPDGKHYSFIDGNKLMIVNSDSRVVCFRDQIRASTSATWIGPTRLLMSGSPALGTNDSDGNPAASAWQYDLETKEWMALPINGWTNPIVVSADGAWLAIGRSPQRVEVRRIEAGFEGEPEFQFPQAPDKILNHIRFSPDGRYLAIGWMGAQAILKVFDLEDGSEVMNQSWPTELKFEFSSDSEVLYCMGRESFFTVWRFLEKPGGELFFDDGHDSSESFEKGGPFVPPQNLLSRNTIDRRTQFLLGHHAPVVSALAQADGGLLTASRDGSMKKWSLDEGRISKFRKEGVHSTLRFNQPNASHNGNYCVFRWSRNQSIRERWHLPSGKVSMLPPFHGEQLPFYGVRPPFYDTLAALNDGRVLLRDKTSQEILLAAEDERGLFQEVWRVIPEGPYQESTTPLIQSAMTSDERYVSTLIWGKFFIIDLVEQKAVVTKDQRMASGSAPGQSTALSPDGKWVAISGFAGAEARVYEVAAPAAGHRIVIPESPYATKDSACVFSRDGSRLFVGNNDGWVRVFDGETLKEITSESWQAHRSEITAIAVSQKGDIIATAGAGKMIIWSTAKELGKPRRRRLSLHPGTIPRNWIQFTAEDSLLFHCGAGRPIEVWEAPRLKN
ncbi:MAG: serine/threonine-protein kinase [Verrucomicrobiales bacterium]